jgi:hypothetical protein
MFPHIVLSTEGLHPQMMYSVTLEIVPADQHRYKFINNQWLPIGMADPGSGVQPVTHPDSPNVGSFWIRNRASFSKVRLTNNKESSVKECSDSNVSIQLVDVNTSFIFRFVCWNRVHYGMWLFENVNNVKLFWCMPPVVSGTVELLC